VTELENEPITLEKQPDGTYAAPDQQPQPTSEQENKVRTVLYAIAIILLVVVGVPIIFMLASLGIAIVGVVLGAIVTFGILYVIIIFAKDWLVDKWYKRKNNREQDDNY
jgi:uncharacterized membrane protein (DUF485 family)